MVSCMPFSLSLAAPLVNASTALPAPFLPAGNETVKAPGNLVVSAYVTCPDITQVREEFPRVHCTGGNWTGT